MPDSARPNVVLISCDQMRAMAIGCYGDPVARTPHIDALAAAGTRFDLATTPNPVCTPARSAMFSGQYSRTCAGMLGNVHRNPPNPKRDRLLDPTLPDILKAAGYRTAQIGKWHIDPQPQLIGFDTALYPMVAHRHNDQTYFDETATPRLVEGFGPYWERDRMHEFLAAVDGPFFLHYGISTPHQPIGPGHLPEKYTSMYDPAEMPLRPNVMVDGKPAHSRHWFSIYRGADYYWRYLREEEQAPEDVAPEDFDLRGLTALYYGAIAFVDDLVGDLVATLKAQGLYDNTIIVFVSDHGDNLGSHNMFNKNQLIEESLRIPLIVRDPRCAGREIVDQPTSIIDILPTVCDLALGKAPAHAQGESLAPVVRGQDDTVERFGAFCETGRMIGIRTPRYLYGLPFDHEKLEVEDGQAWFYDIEADPYEMDNLATHEILSQELREIRDDLHARLLVWDAATPWADVPPATHTAMKGTMADQMATED